ncbi:MAG TPA: peptide-N-glycosidase F-related protein [Bacteroidales bacterium]|nr:peptide-N-glycosidase F-related protein [Bacteroidales bacterium]HPS15731.1 peptide-N-glycosidase F-related protein [Bacteroidales bacterium]
MKKIFFILIAIIAGIVQTPVFSQNFGLDLDGTNDKIGVTDATSLNPTTALTLEVWINADTWKSSVWAGTIIGKQSTSPDCGYCLTAGEGGKAEFTIAIGNVWQKVTTPAVMGLNAWYHIAGVYDGSIMKIYINGELQASLNVTGAMNPSTGKILDFGENPTWTGRLFDGTLDEIRIWNVARSQAQIQASMASELTGTESGLVGYWKMNEGTGTTANDATSNLNKGTLLNMDPATDWVPGFVVTTCDVGVIGIAKPSIFGTGFTSTEKIAIEVKNYSTSPISTFQATYKLNNNTPVTETVNATIPAFGTYIYTFTNTTNLAGQSACTVKAYVSATSDNNHTNDTIQQSITQALENIIFNGVQHNFGSAGQTNIKTVYMPESFDNYSKILLEVSLRCPTGGCDPWDQAAQIKLLKNNTEWELARYITPFGIACGNWEFDITDFKSLLSGKIQLQSFVQVWGASGWLVDITLKLVQGTPDYKYVKVDKLWNTDYLVYGDPAISYDLTDTSIYIEPNTEKAVIRLTTTGHGQGNTNNAAEFMNATHSIKVDGTETFSQNLWKADCSSNSCSNQSGTWQYARAGWCPGQDVQPDFFDLQNHFTPGVPISLDYVLQSYTNSLNTGYDNSSHTEPFLRIHGYLITYSATPLITDAEISNQKTDVLVYPNPANDNIFINVKSGISGKTNIGLYDVIGKCFISEELDNADKSWHTEMDVHKIPAGIYLLKIASQENVIVKKVIIQ